MRSEKVSVSNASQSNLIWTIDMQNRLILCVMFLAGMVRLQADGEVTTSPNDVTRNLNAAAVRRTVANDNTVKYSTGHLLISPV